MTIPELPIFTDRLVLRAITWDDEDALYQMFSREDVSRYLYWEPRTRERVREILPDRIKLNVLDDEHGYLELAVQRKDTGAMIGTVNLNWADREHQQGEIGYIFHPDHGGQGFATEAATEMLRIGFTQLRLHRMYGRLDGRNDASGRVLARLGMHQEAHLRENEMVKGEWTDEIIYAILRTEWLARNNIAE